MSGYAVELTPEAENHLIEIWLDATDRAAVTEAHAVKQRAPQVSFIPNLFERLFS